MATLGLAEQPSLSLPVGLLRRLERLRLQNPDLLQLIERFNGFVFPSEAATISSARPFPKPSYAAIKQSVQPRPAVRDGDPFSALKTGNQVGDNPKPDVTLPSSKADWNLPRASVKTIGTLFENDFKKRPVPAYGGGGSFIREDILPEGLRITEDELVRVTEDDLLRVVEDL